MNVFFCFTCQEWVDEEFDGLEEIDEKWYCKLCADEMHTVELDHKNGLLDD